jgi:hypothetical protein
LFVSSCFFIFWVGEQKELSSHHGWVFPANEPTPQNACGKLKNGQVLVILGPIAVIVDKFPFVFIKVSGQKGIIIDKGPNSSISISLDLDLAKTVKSLQQLKKEISLLTLIIFCEWKERIEVIYVSLTNITKKY